ncbi:MAG: hypothetical protein ABIO70_26955 [Pseudomonadota bacterium]
MRRLAAATLILCLPATAWARKLKTDDGISILPQEGDIGVGFDAVPTLDFLLNASNFAQDTGQQGQGLWDYPRGFDQVLVGRYFLDDDKALRLRLALNLEHDKTGTWYRDPVQVADPDIATGDEKRVHDEVVDSTVDILLGAGQEWRRGPGRLQGLLAVEGLLGLSREKTTTDHGWSYDDDAYDYGVIRDGTSRVLEDDSGLGFTLGVRGAVGIEYFFAPRMCIGAEYGLSAGVFVRGRSSTRSEAWIVDSYGHGDRVVREEDGTSAELAFGTGVDNGINGRTRAGSAALTFMFHF